MKELGKEDYPGEKRATESFILRGKGKGGNNHINDR